MYQRILVPVDGSPTSDRGLQEAIRLAQLTHGELRLIHVIDELSFALGIDSYGYYAGELLDLLRKDGAAILSTPPTRRASTASPWTACFMKTWRKRCSSASSPKPKCGRPISS